MREVVNACHGCLVWGGHVNLSPADDILISIDEIKRQNSITDDQLAHIGHLKRIAAEVREAAARLMERHGTPLTDIGEIREGSGLFAVGEDGDEQPLAEEGWDHFAG